MSYQQAGFSLIELCITVTIAALIMALGVPSFQNLSSENHASSHLDELNSALRLTRHLAVEHNRNAKLCPANPTPDPTDPIAWDCSATGDWSDGWVVLLQDGTGTYRDIMASYHPQDDTAWIATITGGAAISSIVFGSTGTLRAPSSPAVTVSVGQAGGCTKITDIALTGNLSFNAFGC